MTEFLGRVHAVSKKPFPVMTVEMVTGVNSQLTFEDCKKVIRLYLKAIDFRSEMRRDNDVISIHEHMAQQEDFQKKCIAELKEDTAEHRTSLKALSAEKKKCKDQTLLKQLDEEIESTQFEIDCTLIEVNECVKELEQMKIDRLTYLVDNINRYIHGEHWRKVCNRPV